MWHRTLDCLGVAVEIRSTVPGLDAALDALLRTYADAEGPAATAYLLERATWPRLVHDGAVVSQRDHDIDLVATLERELYVHVLSVARGLLLHAGAVVAPDGAALVFSGHSGAGKSTMTRALVARGLRYLTEECVALRAERRCAGLARSLHVDDPTVTPPSGFTTDDYALRVPAGTPAVRLFHPPEARVWRGEARTAAVFVIEHAEDAGDTLRKLSGGELLAALWPMVFRRDEGAIADAAAGLAGVAGYALRTSTPEQALARVLAVASELGVAA
jgi:hypothetical protein